VKLFKKPNSQFSWYDFTAWGLRYRGSTQETKSVRALQVASLKFRPWKTPIRFQASLLFPGSLLSDFLIGSTAAG
jgi:hypothetical protein